MSNNHHRTAHVMRRLALIAAIALGLTACGTAAVRDEKRIINGVPCIVIANSDGTAVSVDCDWSEE